MTLVRWQPREFRSMQREIDDLVNTFWGSARSDAWQPRVDISETENEVVLQAELPGISRDDIKVTLEEKTLTIEGEKKAATEGGEGNVHRSERAYGRFSRTFQLGTQVDTENLSAVYKDGVLTLTLPKAEAAKPKEIEVKVA